MTQLRHKYREGVPTAKFRDLNKKERTQSINAQKLNLKKCERVNKELAAVEIQ